MTLADIVTDIADAGLPIVAVFGGHPAAPVGLDFVLEPLQATDIARLGAAAGVPLHPSAVAAILDLSDGTPFLVQAFAEAALLAAPELPLGAEDVDSGRANALEDVIEVPRAAVHEGNIVYIMNGESQLETRRVTGGAHPRAHDGARPPRASVARR